MNLMNRKLFKTRPARDKLNQMGGIMSSSPTLMEAVQKFQVGGSVDPYYGRMSQPGFPAIRPGSVASKVGRVPSQIMNFLGQANRESGIGQIMQRNQMARAGVSPEDLARVSAATSATQIADQTEARREASASPTMRGPTASQAQMGQNLSMFEQMVEAGANPTMRGPTAGDVRADQTSGRPERPGQLDTAGVETLRGPTSEDIRDYADRRTAGETETMRGPTAEDVDNYFAFGQGSLIGSAESDDPAAAAQAGQQVASNVKSALEDPAASDEEKNETALEFLGLKDPGKKLSRKEQIEKNKEFYREVFGVDPEEDKKIDGYNLAMMGFMIASGDSPNALQNIARGAAQGVKGFMRTAEKRQSREDKLTQLAVADYQSQVKSEAAREQWRLDYNLKVQELIDKRDQAKSKADKDRINAILSAVDDPATALVIGAMDDINELTSEGGLERVAVASKKLLAMNPNLAAKEDGFRDRRDPDEVVINYLDSYDSADTLGKRQMNQDVASYFGKDPKQVTDFDREKYARDRVSRVYESDPAPAPAPESVSAPQEVQTFPPMPSDKNALQDGATYNTPRGPATWNASTEQFIAVE